MDQEQMTVPMLQQMKRDKKKIFGVVAWDYQIAKIVDKVGVDMISVGDSVGINLLGHTSPLEITMDELMVFAKAVRRGTKRALVSVDLPFGPVQESTAAAVKAAIRIVKEAGADMVKVDAAADCPETVEAIVRAGIPVFAQFGVTPQTALALGVSYEQFLKPGAQMPTQMVDKLVEQAKRLESAGATALDFSHSGQVAGPAVVEAVSIPVIGGQGGGPWLDGRVRLVSGATNSVASAMDSKAENYANVARTTFEAMTACAADVRAGRHIKGQAPAKPAA